MFDCLAIASILSRQRTKFQPRACVCIFLSYPTGLKTYKLYDLHNKQIFLSRDVVFHENIFPFHSTKPTESLVNLFFDLVLPSHTVIIPLTPPSIPPHPPVISSPEHQPDTTSTLIPR